MKQRVLFFDLDGTVADAGAGILRSRRSWQRQAADSGSVRRGNAVGAAGTGHSVGTICAVFDIICNGCYDACMRTTVTLDADVAARLQEAMQRQGTPFKETLSSALRRALAPTGDGPAGEGFRVQARPLELKPGLDALRLRELDDDLEMQEFLRKTAGLAMLGR